MSRPANSLSIPLHLQRRYLAGEFNQAEFARHLGVSLYALRRALVRLGLPTLSPAGRHWVLRTVPRGLVERYKRGELTIVDIARRLGISRPTVALRLREQGVHIRTASEVASLRGRQQGGPRDREIGRLRAKGWAVTAIAGRFGISRTRVRQILKAAAGGP